MGSKVMHTPREVQSGYEYSTRTVKRAVVETVGSRFDSCLCDKFGPLGHSLLLELRCQRM